MRVAAFRPVRLDRALQRRREVEPEHTVDPDQLGLRVAAPQRVQKVFDLPLQPRDVLGAEAAVRRAAVFKAFAGLRVAPRGLVEGAAVVRAEVDEDIIRLPGREVVRFMRAEHFVPRAGQQAADQLIDRRQRVVRVVVPRAADAPAALGEDAHVGADGLRRHDRVVVFGAEEHRDPVLLRLRADAPLAARDAVADELELQRARLDRLKAAVRLKRADLQQTFRVAAHRLRILHDAHVFDGFRVHAAEHADAVRPLLRHAAGQEFAVDDEAVPWLIHRPVGGELHPELAAAHVDLQPRGRPEQRERVRLPVRPPVHKVRHL